MSNKEAKEAYERKLRAKLDEWNAEIAKMEAQARQAGAESQLEFEKQKTLLQDKMKIANEKLKKLAAASEGAWAEMKLGIDKAFVDMSGAFQAAVDKFKK